MSPQGGTSWTVVSFMTLYFIYIGLFPSRLEEAVLKIMYTRWALGRTLTDKYLHFVSILKSLHCTKVLRIDTFCSFLLWFFQEVSLITCTILLQFINNTFYSHFPNLGIFPSCNITDSSSSQYYLFNIYHL